MKICKNCGEKIFNRAKNAKYCKECALLLAKTYKYKYDKKRILRKREWSKNHRKELNEASKVCYQKKQQIIKILKEKYNCQTLNDLLKGLEITEDNKLKIK